MYFTPLHNVHSEKHIGNPKVTPFKRNMIFQTSILVFYICFPESTFVFFKNWLLGSFVNVGFHQIQTKTVRWLRKKSRCDEHEPKNHQGLCNKSSCWWHVAVLFFHCSNPGSLEIPSPGDPVFGILGGNLIQRYPIKVIDGSGAILFRPGCCAKGWCDKSSKHRVLVWQTFDTSDPEWDGGMWSDRISGSLENHLEKHYRHKLSQFQASLLSLLWKMI